MAELIEREYDLEDLLMLEKAQVFHDNFIDDKVAFVADFPHLADPFAADFQTAITGADAIPLASTVEAQIAVVTDNLNAQLPLARKAMQRLYSYVELAWNLKVKDNEFGRNKYEKARNSQIGMRELLELAYEAAEVPANKTALLAAGYTQAFIDELEVLRQTIHDLNKEQEKMLSLRGTKTQTRIVAYNTVWGFMKQINKASKVTFMEDPAKLDLYQLYHTSSSSLPKVQNLTGVLVGGPGLNIDLSWDAVEGATEYEIEKSQVPLGQPVGSWIPLATHPETTFSDPIGGGSSYYYRVRARNATLTGAWSNTVQVDA